MNAKAEVEGAGLDKVKLAAAALLLVGGIYAYLLFRRLIDPAVEWSRCLVDRRRCGVAVAHADRAWSRPVAVRRPTARMEVRKVVWPTRQETLQTTLVVIVMVLILAIVLWLFDMVLMAILQVLTGKGARIWPCVGMSFTPIPGLRVRSSVRWKSASAAPGLETLFGTCWSRPKRSWRCVAASSARASASSSRAMSWSIWR